MYHRFEKALWDSANEKVGAPDMPNIFQSYQDTATALDKVVSLVDLDEPSADVTSVGK